MSNKEQIAKRIYEECIMKDEIQGFTTPKWDEVDTVAQRLFINIAKWHLNETENLRFCGQDCEVVAYAVNAKKKIADLNIQVTELCNNMDCEKCIYNFNCFNQIGYAG